MKDRLTLALLMVILWLFLVVFQKYVPLQSSIYLILGFMIFYALLLHAAQFHQKRKLRKKPPVQDLSYEPFVSILVPANNEQNVIEETVVNLLNIDYEKFELIIIDDRSTDNTAGVLSSLQDKFNGKLKFYTRPQDAFPGKSAVLNEALEMTKGDIICIFDADARVKPDFLNKILPSLSDVDTGAVQARKVIINKEKNLLTRCQNNEYALDSHFQYGRDSIKGAVELRGNGQLIKKIALKDVGGWNDETLTDDLDLSTRLHLKGWDVRFCPAIEVYEEGVINFYPLLRQRRRWVEGSIRRYLDYFVQVVFSKEVSLRVKVDMWAYISEFVMPVWLLSEWGIQGIRLIKGINDNVLSAVAVIPVLFIFFSLGLIYGIRKYNNQGIVKTLIQSAETGLYMVLIWTPIVIFIVFKIIFSKRTMDWGKTQHGVELETVEAESVPVNNI